jgi:hypothetical protein
MRRWTLLPTAVAAAVLMLAGGFAAFAPASMAQGTTGTPDAMGTPGATGHDHPAHIHGGTCDALGEVVYPLDNLTDADGAGTPAAGMDASPMADMTGTPAAGMGEVVARSTTTVEASLDDVLAGEHAINVHESVDNIQNYIACGDLTGAAEDGQLQIDLNELNDSGYEGMAVIEDNGDGTITVMVTLTSTEDAMATPAA